MTDIWAIIPVKEFDGAKHRLSGLLSPPQRRLLADTMQKFRAEVLPLV